MSITHFVMESSNFSPVVQLVVYEIILRRKTDYWSVTVYETAESCLDKKEEICLSTRPMKKGHILTEH